MRSSQTHNTRPPHHDRPQLVRRARSWPRRISFLLRILQRTPRSSPDVQTDKRAIETDAPAFTQLHSSDMSLTDDSTARHAALAQGLLRNATPEAVAHSQSHTARMAAFAEAGKLDDESDEQIGASDTFVAEEESAHGYSSGCCSSFVAFRRSPGAVLLVVSLALFVDLLVYCIIIPVLPLYVKDELHGSDTAIGVLFACYAGGLLLATPLSAVWSDRADSRRLPMLTGLGAMAASTVLFGFATELWQLALARAAQGMSAAVSNTVGLAMLADVYPTSMLPTQLGIAMAVNGLGGLIGPPLGGALYEHVSYKAVFYVCGGFAALDLIFRIILINDGAMRMQRDKIRRATLREAERKALAAARSRKDSVVSDPVAPGTVTLSLLSPVLSDPSALDPFVAKPVSIWTLAAVPSIQASLLGVVVLSTVFTGLEPLLALHFNRAFDSSSSMIGYSYFAIAIPYSLASIFIAAPLQEKGAHPKLLVSAGMGVLTLSLAAFPWPNSLGLSLLPMIVFGIAIGLAITPPLGEIGEYLTVTGKSHAFATGFAMFNLSYAVGMFAGPLFSATLYDYTNFLVVMSVMAGLSALLSLFLLVVGTKEKREQQRVKRIEEQQEAEAALTSPAPTTTHSSSCSCCSNASHC